MSFFYYEKLNIYNVFYSFPLSHFPTFTLSHFPKVIKMACNCSMCDLFRLCYENLDFHNWFYVLCERLELQGKWYPISSDLRKGESYLVLGFHALKLHGEFVSYLRGVITFRTNQKLVSFESRGELSFWHTFADKFAVVSLLCLQHSSLENSGSAHVTCQDLDQIDMGDILSFMPFIMKKKVDDIIVECNRCKDTAIQQKPMQHPPGCPCNKS